MSQINKLLKHLVTLEFASDIKVFGSVATGKAEPTDLDIFVDFSTMTRRQYLLSDPGGARLQPLLNLAWNYYGSFDPFLRFANDDLLVRSDDASKWIKSKNAGAICANMDAQKRSLQEIYNERCIELAPPLGQPFKM